MVPHIRTAVEADIPRIVDMIIALAKAVDGPQWVCRATAGGTVAGLIRDPDGIVLVSERGFIAGRIMATIINPEPVAFEMGWFAEDRSGLRLLRAFEGWAEARGVTLIKLSCNGGAAQRILARRGYRVAEIQMVR